MSTKCFAKGLGGQVKANWTKGLYLAKAAQKQQEGAISYKLKSFKYELLYKFSSMKDAQ